MSRVLRFFAIFLSPFRLCTSMLSCFDGRITLTFSCKVLRPSPWTKVRHWDRNTEGDWTSHRERERLREKERQRQTDTETDRQTDRQTDRHWDRLTDRHYRQTDRDRETVRDRDKDRETETDKDREMTETETKTANRSAMFSVPCWCLPPPQASV